MGFGEVSWAGRLFRTGIISNRYQDVFVIHFKGSVVGLEDVLQMVFQFFPRSKAMIVEAILFTDVVPEVYFRLSSGL